MTKSEFLQGLRQALETELDAYAVQEQVQYYDRYITDEMNKGMVEREVLDMLGDPWAIARNILEFPGSTAGSSAGYSEYYDTTSPAENGYYQGEDVQKNVHVYHMDSKWKVWAVLAVLVLIIVAIFGIVLGIINLLAPILIPVLVILIVIRIFGKKK